MTTEIVLIALSLVTLGAALFVALSSKKQTDDRKRDPNAPKSTLAEDAPNTPRSR